MISSVTVEMVVSVIFQLTVDVAAMLMLVSQLLQQNLCTHVLLEMVSMVQYINWKIMVILDGMALNVGRMETSVHRLVEEHLMSDYMKIHCIIVFSLLAVLVAET